MGILLLPILAGIIAMIFFIVYPSLSTGKSAHVTLPSLHLICILSTPSISFSPLLRQETLNGFCKYVLENDFDTVLSVADEKAESFFNGEPINFSLAEKVNSQYLEPVRKVVWALTAWKKDNFLKARYEGKCPVYAGKLGLYTIPTDESCDLDTEEDWTIAEGILLGRRTNSEKKYWKNN